MASNVPCGLYRISQVSFWLGVKMIGTVRGSSRSQILITVPPGVTPAVASVSLGSECQRGHIGLGVDLVSSDHRGLRVCRAAVRPAPRTA